MFSQSIPVKMHLKHSLRSGQYKYFVYTLKCINLHQSSTNQSAKTVYWTLLTICMCKYTRFVASFQPYVYTFLSLFSLCLSDSLFSSFPFFVPSNWRVYFSQWFPQSEPLHACVYVLSALKKCDQFNFIRLTISRCGGFDWVNRTASHRFNSKCLLYKTYLLLFVYSRNNNNNI